MRPIIRSLLLLLVLAPFNGAIATTTRTDGVPEEARERMGPGRRGCAAYGRKHRRHGRCGRRNHRVERFLRGYTW
jgi:hypothetical protein